MNEAIDYTVSRTGEEFHKSDAFIRAVRGPVGSGKSSMMVFDMLQHAMQQKPFNGVRRSRGLVVRNTYSELKSTTIRTWMQWIGALGEITYDSPIRFKAEQLLDDGTRLDFEVFFLPLDSEADVKKLKSLEVSFAWINEFSEVPMSALKLIRGRVGRFPGKQQGGCTWAGVVLDTNPYPIRSEWYNLFEVQRPKGHRLFVQPGGLMRDSDDPGQYIPNPDAENIPNLPGGYDYYFNQVAGSTDDYVKVFILGEPGATFEGKAVFANTYDDNAHVARDGLAAMRTGGLIVGLDFGLNPAAVITQMSPIGTLMVLDEVAPVDVTFEEFVVEQLLPLLRNKYPSHSVLCIGDPAGLGRNPINKQTVFDMLKLRGLAAQPAYTNEFPPRRDAVAFFLTRRNGFIMSPSCVSLREAMAGGYRFAKSTMSSDVFKEKPEKTYHSHISDALQYAATHYYKQIVRPNKQRVRSTAPAQPFLYA